MGCYGIGIERILTAAIEQNHDANGFWLARSIAPFDVVVTVTNMGDAHLAATAEQVAMKLEDAGFDVLLDDRDERAGVKFKDADLVGIPFRINVGKKAAEGRLELVTRSTATSQDVAIAEIVGAGAGSGREARATRAKAEFLIWQSKSRLYAQACWNTRCATSSCSRWWVARSCWAW